MRTPPGTFGRFRDRARARRDGKHDGQLGIPTTNEVAHPPALMTIAQRADEAVADLVRWWAGEDARLRERFGANTYGLRTSEEDIRTASVDVTDAQERRRALDADRDTDVLEPPTPAGARISTRVYAVAIIAILLAEFPLNAIAFRLFGEAELLTWVMTGGLAVMLVVCAHGLGTFLRLEQPTMAERRWVWILIAVPVLALLGIAFIRARYLSLDAAVTGLNVLGPVVGSLVFLVINLLIYTGATMLSYLAHAPRLTPRRPEETSGTHRSRSPEETIALVQPWLRRAGVTRIADVTGLDSVGVPTTLAIRPNALTMACSSGKGVTFEQAYISGAMEACELHAAETAILPSVRASYHELAVDWPMPKASDLPLSRWGTFSPDWPLNWFLGWDLIGQREVPIPLATVGMSRSAALISSVGAFNVSSNGLGAGNTFLEAVAAGLYEVIERDAVACQYFAAQHGEKGIPVVPEVLLRQYPLVSGVLDRTDSARVRVVVHDCTTDTNVPAFDAIVYDKEDQGVGVVRGSGAHLDPEVAVLRAITEALQARLNFIAGSRDDIFRAAFVRYRADWARSVATIEQTLLESPEAGPVQSCASDAFEDDIHKVLAGIQAVGLDHVVVVDLTPEDLPVKIVRVVVPGLEGYMHHGYHPGRRAKSQVGAGREE